MGERGVLLYCCYCVLLLLRLLLLWLDATHYTNKGCYARQDIVRICNPPIYDIWVSVKARIWKDGRCKEGQKRKKSKGKREIAKKKAGGQ
jgi:hypothetical protein